MVLEITVICLDDSEYMRYDDFAPSRMHAQGDSARIVCLSKMQADPENEVALVTMSGPEVLVRFTTELERVLDPLAELRPRGEEIDLAATLRMAYFMLKSREDEAHEMRMVIFVGSPVAETIDELAPIANCLKNKNVNVDFVSFGEYAVNMGKLSRFVTILNGHGIGSSRLVSVPAGNILSNVVAGSPIVQGSDYRSFINLEVDDIDPASFLDQQMSLEEHDYEAEASQENASGGIEYSLGDLVRDWEREHGPSEASLTRGQRSTTTEEYEVVELDDDTEQETDDEQTACAMLLAVTLQDQSLPEQTTPVVSGAEPAESDDAMDPDKAKQSAKEDAAGGDEHDGTF